MMKLIFILRYALHMNSRTRCGIRYGIYDARVYVAEFDEWREESPQDAADESINCWDAE